MKAIIIDDEPCIAETIKTILNRKGWECIVLADGVGLETYIKKFNPHIVITDYNLPGENGLEIAEKVKKEGIPCIIITGFPIGQLQEQNADTTFMQKPFTPKELDKELNQLLSSSGSENG